MSTHWLYVTIAWGLAGLLFASLAIGAVRRHAAAARRLNLLDPRRDTRS